MIGVFRDFSIQSQLISDNKSQKAKDLHSEVIGYRNERNSRSGHCQNFAGFLVTLSRGIVRIRRHLHLAFPERVARRQRCMQVGSAVTVDGRGRRRSWKTVHLVARTQPFMPILAATAVNKTDS